MINGWVNLDKPIGINSAARDLGVELNCFGHITQLRKTMVGHLKENESVIIEQAAQLYKHCNSGLPVGHHSSIQTLGLVFYATSIKSFY